MEEALAHIAAIDSKIESKKESTGTTLKGDIL
jgi:hypothetical protein